MEENNVIDKKAITEDNDSIKTSKIRSKKTINIFQEKKCEVINYDKHSKTLDIRFEGYGIRLKNVEKFEGTWTTVKYKGEIGKPNFKILL